MEINGVIQRKLSLLDRQVGNLRKYLEGISRERFADDWGLRSMAERALQVAIEIIIDIAERLIASSNAGPVATALDAIKRIEELGFIKSAAPYREMVKLRNLIVHEYEEIDPNLLYAFATERLAELLSFRNEIDRLE
ncbi:MAG: DUF86 domain-containing protein [Spirochaetota bacterium]